MLYSAVSQLECLVACNPADGCHCALYWASKEQCSLKWTPCNSAMLDLVPASDGAVALQPCVEYPIELKPEFPGTRLSLTVLHIVSCMHLNSLEWASVHLHSASELGYLATAANAQIPSLTDQCEAPRPSRTPSCGCFVTGSASLTFVRLRLFL